jgi:hypothetical protein
VTAAPQPVPIGRPLDIGGLQALWPAVIDTIRGENAMLAAVLAEVRPIGLEQGEAVLAFPPESAFSKRMAESDAHRQLVGEALRTLVGTALRPRYELRELTAEEAPPPPAAAPSGEEIVARFVAEFDAEELIDDEEGA